MQVGVSHIGEMRLILAFWTGLGQTQDMDTMFARNEQWRLNAYGACLRSWLIIVALGFTLFGVNLNAQYKNHMIQLPSVGYMGFNSMDRLIHKHYLDAPVQNVGGTLTPGTQWSVSDQVTIGTGYGYALGYNLWLDVQIAMGIGGATYSRANFQPIISLNTSTGLRYNFTDTRVRPFIAGHFHYLHMFNGAEFGLRRVTEDSNQSLWFGLRAGGGVEWFFLQSLRDWGADIDLYFDEMSFSWEVDAAVFADLNALPLTSVIGRFAYNIYF